jgi:hypothetical protein
VSANIQEYRLALAGFYAPCEGLVVPISEAFPTPEVQIWAHPEFALAANVDRLSAATVDQRKYNPDRWTDHALENGPRE